MTLRRTLHLVLGAVASTVLLVGCSSTAAEPDSPSAEGDRILNFGISGEAPVLKAGTEQGNLGNTLNSLVHRGLVTYDGTGALIPALAETFEQVSPDEYRFTLREDLTFHDGTAVTLDRVRESMTYFADPESGTTTAPQYGNISEIVPGEGGEFSIFLENNDSSFLQVLADVNTPILPEVGLQPETDNIVGAGPFSYVDRESGVSMTLERFDGFYDAENLALDGVKLAYYADGAARVNALLGGDVDLIDYVPWESFDQVEAAGFTVDGEMGPGLDVQFNFQVPPWNNPEVRRAVAHAIDRDKVVSNVFSGHASPSYGLIVQGGSEYDTPLATEMYTYDPELARQILADAGFAEGIDTTLQATSQYAFVQDTAISVQQDLAAVGIRVELDLPDWPTMMENMLTGKYELGIGTISANVTDPSYLLRFVLPPAYSHPWGYENPEVISLLQRARAADTDEERIDNFEQAFAVLKEDTPFVVMMQRSQAYAYSDRVSGFKTIPGLIVFSSGLTVAQVSLS